MAELYVYLVIEKLILTEVGYMRKQFADELTKQAKTNDKIWLITADLGFGLWDQFKDEIPNRFLNTGASEQAASDICVGLALEGKIPFFYSITTFGLYRCFETWRTYVNYEKIPVKLCMSGRDKDYLHDGISHWSEDAKDILDTLPNIHTYWPNKVSEVKSITRKLVTSGTPEFLSLRR